MTEVPLWLEMLEKFFVAFTGAIVAFGILSVEMDLLHVAVTALRRRLGREKDSDSTANPILWQPTPSTPQGSVRRFDGHQRVQHLLLMLSFIVLAVTGLAEKFYRYPPAEDFIAFLGGWDAVRLIHRTAAFVMLASVLYHLIYVSRGVMAGKVASWQDMVPNRKDINDFFHMVAHYLGFRSQPPQFGRFSYMEKFDYWAVFWGIVIMAGSGLVLMFPGLLDGLGGTALVAASLTAHSDEAVLAVAWIGVVHLYHAHFNPRVFPINTTIFTGRIPLPRLQEEHALEYQQLEEAAPLVARGPAALSQEAFGPLARATDLPGGSLSPPRQP